ncbi:hypothetical protein BVRB_029430, partial [Beta vulgaris subsp. vulgaris]
MTIVQLVLGLGNKPEQMEKVIQAFFVKYLEIDRIITGILLMFCRI